MADPSVHCCCLCQIFDLCGFIVIKNALAEDEVDVLNAAIDHQLPLTDPQPHASMAGGNHHMFGASNVHVKIAERLNGIRTAAVQTSAADLAEQLKGADFPPPMKGTQATGNPAGADALRAALAVITPGGALLTADEQLAAMDAAEPDEDGSVRIGVGRTDLHGMLQWEHPWCDPFRRQLLNPVVQVSIDTIHTITFPRRPLTIAWASFQPYLQTLLGSGYRMDHMPHLMLSDKGCDGHNLHGGGANRFAKGGFLEAYQYVDGKLFTGMVTRTTQAISATT